MPHGERREGGNEKRPVIFNQKRLEQFNPLERKVILTYYEPIFDNLVRRVEHDHLDKLPPEAISTAVREEIEQEIERMADILQEVTVDFFKIQQESLYDPKTHLLNVHSFNLRFDIEKEAQARKQEQSASAGREAKETGESKKTSAILFFDLDEFKRLNDTYGHILVDEMLAKVGENLNKQLRTYDAASRFGGDELVVLLNNITPEKLDGAAARAYKIVNSVGVAKDAAGKPYITSGWDSEEKGKSPITERVSASVGAYAFNPTEESDLKKLLVLGDRAASTSKQNGRSGYTVIKKIDENGSAEGTFVQFPRDDSNEHKRPTKAKEVTISKDNEREKTREGKKAEIVEALNRSLACARGANSGKLPSHIQDTIDLLADQVFIECEGSFAA